VGVRRTDFVSIIEAAYAAPCDEESWLRGIVSAIERACDRHDGIGAYTFDVSDPKNFRFGPIAISDGLSLGPITRMVTLASEGVVPVSSLYEPNPPVGLMSEVMRPWDSSPRHHQTSALEETGFADILGIRGVNADGSGILVCLAQNRRRSFAPRTRGAFARVARHLAAAQRMRRRLLARSGGPDAVLSPSGRLEHVERHASSARELGALPRAVRSMEAARGRLRRADPEHATELWRALVEGRWSLVETLESDGKRWLFAERNEHDVRGLRTLSANEKQVTALAARGFSNKAIAYDLGFSTAKVSTTLKGALNKLGLSSRAALTRWYPGHERSRA
jgi:DNA-binding CsgD family transcriptional regulator